MSDSYQYAQEHQQDFVSQLKDWLRIPSISADPAYTDDIIQAAEWLAADMRRIGLEHVQVMPTGGHPIVYADWLHAGPDAPTVLIYGHYDVQPAVMADGWDSEPFEPVERGGYLYARGATDDKGQVMIQVKAAEAMLSGDNRPPVNLKYLIEGEEESTSLHLAGFIKAHADMLAADVCVISDTGMQSPDQPLLVYGLRGIMAMEIQVQGPRTDLHSGGFGGMVHNPAQVIAEIVAALHNPDGTVAVPGFYDAVQIASEAERAELNRMTMSDAEWAAQVGDVSDWGEPGYTRVERTGIRPTLEVNGIYGGYSGDGFKTVLPARAGAKISCRLVPDQEPSQMFALVRDYIQSIAPDTVTLSFREHGHGAPAITPVDHPALQAAIRAYARFWDNPPLLSRGGGSIPVVSDIQTLLDVPVVLLGFGLPDSQIHGPNESFNLELYHKGIATVMAFMEEISS